MPIDRAKFFLGIRPTPLNTRRLVQSQVATLDAILDETERRNWDLRWAADVMGTALGETGINLAPVREGFAKSDAGARAAVASLYRRGKIRRNYALPVNGISYYGRGLVQVTHLDNYRKLTDIAKAQGHDVDFVKNPDLLLEPKWAVWASFEGMERGTYTGKKLADFYNKTVTEWVKSRQIINGMDRAAEFGANKKQFYADLVDASR